MNSSEQFLRYLLSNPSVQEEITTLNFAVIQSVAANYGYVINAAEVDAVLAQSPELVAQLQALIDNANFEFELDEAEMALIAGGNTVDCGTAPLGSLKQ